jgi:hypothetical protein
LSVNAVGDGGQGGAPRRLRSVAAEVVSSLYQHRLLSTARLRELHAPEASRQWMQRVLSELAREGLVAFASGRGSLRVWHLTEAGAELAEASPDRVEERRKLLDARQAAGVLQAHTLAVNEVGIAFLRAARERGDEFTPTSWQHEVDHPIGPPPGMRRGELLVADAAFSYPCVGPQGEGSWRLEYRFLELDRATVPSERLAPKLARYARLYRFRPRPEHKGAGRPPPAWRARYPVFPALLVVFAHPRAAEAHLETAERSFGDIQATLDRALDLLADCHRGYRSAPGACAASGTRRSSSAFSSTTTASTEPRSPSPSPPSPTPTCPQRLDGSAGGETAASSGGGSNEALIIGLTGFEPATSPTRTERATRLRHSPKGPKGSRCHTGVAWASPAFAASSLSRSPPAR